jgi:hypothetical protein
MGLRARGRTRSLALADRSCAQRSFARCRLLRWLRRSAETCCRSPQQILEILPVLTWVWVVLEEMIYAQGWHGRLLGASSLRRNSVRFKMAREPQQEHLRNAPLEIALIPGFVVPLIAEVESVCRKCAIASLKIAFLAHQGTRGNRSRASTEASRILTAGSFCERFMNGVCLGLRWIQL